MPAPNQKSLSSRAALYVAAICAAILGLESWREWNSYGAAVQRAVSSGQNLAHSLRQHADDTFELARDTVRAVAHEAQSSSGLSEGELAAVAARMRHTVSQSSRPLRIDIYAADGKWLATTAQNQPPGPRQTGYSYFQYHRNSISLAPFIGRPIQAPDGDWQLTVSQRLDLPDGSFGGVVVATLDSQYFSRFYGTFDVGQRGSITLASTSGTLLARWPYDSREVGRDLGQTQGFKEIAERPTGDFQTVSTIDGVFRISAFDTSPRYSLVAVVAVSRDEVMAPWLAGAVQRLSIAAALTLVVALLGLRLVDQIRRRQRSETTLEQKEAEFRLLAESASDLVERFGPDGRRLYVSPAMERLLGHKPQDLIGTSAFDTINDEDRPAVFAATERLRRQETSVETLLFRAQHKDGRELWLETALSVAAATESQPEGGVVGVTRDVTQRKLLEMRLAELATIDGLTGLSNRRAFDDALAREVARCSRSRSPLSLLMIDCDRFKRFNDDYGHLAGDTCLKAIAGSIGDRARRPLDLAARFGGEEMTLLLPDTDLAAARAIGTEICRHVQALGIPHKRNLPWKVATISVGIATLDPQDGDTRDGEWLIATADLALYDAKAQGRNQCVAPLRPHRTRLVS